MRNKTGEGEKKVVRGAKTGEVGQKVVRGMYEE